MKLHRSQVLVKTAMNIRVPYKVENLLTNRWSTPLHVMFVERGHSIWGRTNWSAGKNWGWWGKLMDLITRDSFQLIFLQAQPRHTYNAYSPNKRIFSLHSLCFLSLWLHCLIQFLWQAEYYRTTSLIKSERISNSSKSINKSARLST